MPVRSLTYPDRKDSRCLPNRCGFIDFSEPSTFYEHDRRLVGPSDGGTTLPGERAPHRQIISGPERLSGRQRCHADLDREVGPDRGQRCVSVRSRVPGPCGGGPVRGANGDCFNNDRDIPDPNGKFCETKP